MFRFLSFVLLLCFFLWIIPLGVFIGVSKEKLACDGQRAICLCSHLMKHVDSGKGKIIFTGSTATQKEEGFSSGHYFLSFNSSDKRLENVAQYFKEEIFLYNSLVCRAIEHVPKV